MCSCGCRQATLPLHQQPCLCFSNLQLCTGLRLLRRWLPLLCGAKALKRLAAVTRLLIRLMPLPLLVVLPRVYCCRLLTWQRSWCSACSTDTMSLRCAGRKEAGRGCRAAGRQAGTILSFLKQQQSASGVPSHVCRPLHPPSHHAQEKCHQRGERPPAWVRWIDAPGNWAERASERLEDAVSVGRWWLAWLVGMAALGLLAPALGPWLAAAALISAGCGRSPAQAQVWTRVAPLHPTKLLPCPCCLQLLISFYAGLLRWDVPAPGGGRGSPSPPPTCQGGGCAEHAANGGLTAACCRFVAGLSAGDPSGSLPPQLHQHLHGIAHSTQNQPLTYLPGCCCCFSPLAGCAACDDGAPQPARPCLPPAPG
jgi:hypothetical protein